MTSVETAVADAGQGLLGDRYNGRSGSRQVTLIQREHLGAIASHLGLDLVAPDQLRRNIVVEGINLAALKDHHFRLGSALLAWTGECHPCSRMEEAFGPGGYNAVRGHGGITARVIEGGTIAIGDRLERLPATSL
ncbi:MOSC domain-containing protein [Bosea sp. CRIB-10]|uniref:MOSC domain-containing protein n=1 Tax=Bosea sp. CRIB-10 TaxID=378404 RepID=UPI0008EE94C0|nr:MOSC domain-containing protein [Bosea sp. CRIB-10]SFD00881.1 MOSC domain-containing protein [Bosea sp. CRIB-10]